jgi:hypothetical protein
MAEPRPGLSADRSNPTISAINKKASKPKGLLAFLLVE